MTANEFYGPELAQMRLAERQVLEAVEELQRVWKAQGRQSPVLYTSSRIKSPESMCRKLAQRGQPQTRQAALAHPESLLAQGKEITGRTAVDAAQQGDATAKAVVAQYAVYVAAGLTDFVNILAPEMILLGGGISRQGEALLAPVREYVATHCFGQREGAIPTIAAAKLGNEAGIIGAAAL